MAVRPGRSGVRPFRLPVPEYPALRSVSTPRSSNRTCPFRASGFRSRVFMLSHTIEAGVGCRPALFLRLGMQCLLKLPDISGVVRLTPISLPLLLTVLPLNQGPFPPPALPGFVSTTGLSAIPHSPALPSRAAGCVALRAPHRTGLPVLPQNSSCQHAVINAPVDPNSVCFARVLSGASLPHV